MKKFTLKHVFEGFRSTVQQPTAKPEQVSVVESLRQDNFQVAKTVRHGFPYQPTAVAFDPIQKVLAVGTKHGSIRLIGRPGVDVHVKHESEAAVLHVLFLMNEGALVTATADDFIHLWNYRQKRPEIVHSLKFQRERITCLHLPFQSKWLYVGTERGNIHIVNIEVFHLSGYIVNWNKAIELSRKTHPGPVVHLSDCPADPGKLLIGYESGQLVFWDLKTRMAEVRFQCAEPLKSISWHHEGKQFMCSHTDGSLTTWAIKQTGPKPSSVIFPHAKTNKEGKQETCKSIQKVEWKSSKTGESFVIFSGGLANDRAGRTPSITVIHGKTTTVLEMEHNVVDFVTLCETPYASEFAEPYALVVLLHNDLVVVDLHSPGYPCFENPYSMDLHESPVTCCTYLADCPADLIPAFYSVGARGQKRQGFSEREWPICGGEWGSTSCSYAEMIITGHADGSIKFWDASSVSLQVLYKLKTAKVFEKPKTRSIDGDEDPFAIQHIFLCPESRFLCVAGATSHVILFKYSKQETVAEISCLEIPIVYEVYESGDCSPEYEFPPRPTLQASVDYFVPIHVRGGSQKKASGYQAELVCVTPWVEGEPPGPITALAINSSYGLLSYGNESGLVIVDYVAKSCLLNMGTPDLYGAADPYQRVPRSPKRNESSKEEERCKSPSSDQDNKDMGSSTFYLRRDQSETDELIRKESKEDLKDSRKFVNRSDSKGDSEVLKLLRKDSKGIEKIKDEKKNSNGKYGSDAKAEIMKLLGRKESKGKERDDRDSKGKEGEREDKFEDDFLLVKKNSASEGNDGAEEAVEQVNDDLWQWEEGEDDDDKAEGGYELRPDRPRSRSITPEHFPKTEMGDDKQNNHDAAKRHSRFRLKEQLTKLDAKFRKAFSSEHNSIEQNSDFYVDDITVIGPDGERKEIENTSDHKGSTDIEDAEEAEEAKDDSEKGNEVNIESNNHEVKPGAFSASPKLSPRETPKTSPRPTPKATPRPSPIDEAKFIEQDLAKKPNVQEGADRKSLALFDKDGNPVPPPRRKVRLSEVKQKSSRSSFSSCDLGKDSNVSHAQGAGNAGPLSISPVEEGGGFSDHHKFFQKCQGSDTTPVQTPTHTGATPPTAGASITSPNSKGAFKTFVSHITKRGSSHALQGMLFCSPLGTAKTLLRWILSAPLFA